MLIEQGAREFTRAAEKRRNDFLCLRARAQECGVSLLGSPHLFSHNYKHIHLIG